MDSTNIGAAISSVAGGWREHMLPILLDFQANHGAIIQMIAAIGWTIGAFTLLSAIFKLKTIGENSGGDGDQTIGGVFVMLIVGVCLMHLPSVVEVGTSTFFGDNSDSVFAYAQTGGSQLSGWSFFVIEIAKAFVKALGLAAIISCLLHFKRMGEGQKEQAGKGWWHLIGGVLAWNVNYVIEFFAWAVGI